MKYAWKTGKTVMTPEDRAAGVQKLCLLAVIALEMAFFLLEDRAAGVSYLYVEQYLTLPAMAFLGASLCRDLSRRDRWQLYAGLAMVGLFFLNQTLHQVLEQQSKAVGTFVCAYALCFPFAAAARDAERQWGLKRMAGLFLAVGVLITLYTVLLFADALPEFLKTYVKWDGGRLYAMGHPNICATLLMLSIGLCAGFALQSRRIWVRVMLPVLILVQFWTLSLTNGRTTIILTCILLGGIAFCALRGNSWKRFVLALLAAVVVMAGAFGGSRAVYHWNQGRILEQMQSAPQTETETPEAVTQEASDVLVSEQFQGTLAHDMKTLNGRTEIWRTAFLGLEENPRVKWIGTEYVEMILTRYAPLPIYHTHNSWLEALYRLGLPGLAAALVITILTVWSALTVLWRNRDLWKSCIALITLCLLGCGLLEPYLFMADVSYHYLDFLFLMCLGYLCLWRREKADCAHE